MSNALFSRQQPEKISEFENWHEKFCQESSSSLIPRVWSAISPYPDHEHPDDLRAWLSESGGVH